MIDTNAQPNAIFTQELFYNIQKEFKEAQKRKNEPCIICNWKSPERCKECQGVNKTVVLTVNKRGIK
jgi:hypothetical protein